MDTNRKAELLVGRLEEMGKETALFRGQCDGKWTLTPNLGRMILRGQHSRCASLSDWLEAEKRITLYFQGEADRFEEPARRYIREQEEYVKQTIMQHYGVPTRLLDWTLDPLVALFFACSGDSPSSTEQRDDIDGAIWLFFREDYKEAAECDHLSMQAKNRPEDYCLEGCTFENRNSKDEYLCISKCAYHSGGISFVRVVSYFDGCSFPRAIAQSGLFTIAGHPCQDHKVLLDGLLSSRRGLQVIKVDSDIKNACRLIVAERGYTRDKLMKPEPSLDGWGSDVREMLRYWADTGKLRGNADDKTVCVVGLREPKAGTHVRDYVSSRDH